MTIATVLRSGGRYDYRWVDRLERMVVEHAPKGATFTALVDAHPWPGWWAKMGIFDPSLLSGTVLYVDLDTDIVGPLDWAASYTGDLALLSDFYRPSQAQSGVMLFNVGEETERLWRYWTGGEHGPPEHWMQRYRGDGEWLHAYAYRPDRLQDLFPGEIVSHKVHGATDGASIVCYHGEPKPDTLGLLEAA